jgi:FkbM family methyltransferase
MHDVTVKGRQFYAKAGTFDRFWRRVNKGVWEPATYTVFEDNIDKDTLVIDFGSWMGSTVFFAAQLAQKCVGFEPDPSAFAELSENVKLNAKAGWADRLEVFGEAIHESGKPIEIHTSTVEGGDSMSSSLSIHRPNAVTVETRTLQAAVNEFRKKAKKVFIKIDIEGGEFTMMPEIADLMADPDFTFNIEFHHRMLFRSHKTTSDSNPKWKEEYQEKMDSALASIPWNRAIYADTGEKLDSKGVQNLIAGKANTDSLVIRSS